MNLIITCSRHFEEQATNEISSILKDLGDINPRVNTSSLSGIVTVTTSLDPFFIVKKIQEKILDEPWSIRYCLRIIPIQETTITDVTNIVNLASNLIKIIKPKDTYRITIEKRHSTISTKEIIETIANKIPNKVSLENFDWMILIEILGRDTGVSILKEMDIIRTQKLKRSLSE